MKAYRAGETSDSVPKATMPEVRRFARAALPRLEDTDPLPGRGKSPLERFAGKRAQEGRRAATGAAQGGGP